MDTTNLSILICSNNKATTRQMRRTLTGEGVQFETSERLFNEQLCFSPQNCDCLVVDLDGLNTSLRSLLPTVFRQFPNSPRIGIFTKSVNDSDTLDQSLGLELDAYLTEIPHPEDLIVFFPRVAEKYLCDIVTLKELIPYH